jgi:branched-chain amino acid transport system substrate-binding protein
MRHSCRAVLLVLTAAAVILGLAPTARAEGRTCKGPPECCPTEIASELTPKATVRLSVTLVALGEINERAGTWYADFYLAEWWKPQPGFTPQTEIVNEVRRDSELAEVVGLQEGECFRTRRVRSTLRSDYNLRAFPFDHQALTIQFSDSWWTSEELAYTERPGAANLDEASQMALSSWKVEGPMTHSRKARAWQGEHPQDFDYATFVLPVRRHITFHLTKFFLPLLLIVVIAFTVFWIDPKELGAQVGVGVTCLLSAIAFQFAEASNLPEVAYLTLADRVYAVCYIAIALALVATVRANAHLRRADEAGALRLLRRCRVGFPVALGLAISVGVVLALR